MQKRAASFSKTRTAAVRGPRKFGASTSSASNRGSEPGPSKPERSTSGLVTALRSAASRIESGDLDDGLFVAEAVLSTWTKSLERLLDMHRHLDDEGRASLSTYARELLDAQLMAVHAHLLPGGAR